MNAQQKSRWHDETIAAAVHLNWSVVESKGTSDYQGSGVHLLRMGKGWATLAWNFGSCGHCDPYEDEIGFQPTPERCAEVFGGLITQFATEGDARQAFSLQVGW